MLGVTVSLNFKDFLFERSPDNHCIPSSDCSESSLVRVPTVCCSLKYFMNQISNNQNFSEPKVFEILQKHKKIFFSQNGTAVFSLSSVVYQ